MPGPLTPRHKQRVYLYLSIYLGFHDAAERPQTFSPQQGVHAAYPKKSQSLLAFRVDGMACTAVAPSAVPPELLCLETLEEMQVSETSPKLSEFAYAEGFAQRFNACSSPKEVLAQFSHLPVAVVARALYDGSPNPLLLSAVLGHHAPYCQSLAQEYPLLFAPSGAAARCARPGNARYTMCTPRIQRAHAAHTGSTR
jgi:hypothetical protein